MNVGPSTSALRQLDPEQLGDHVVRLYRAAYGLCGSREDAEDLVQSTYERVLRRPRFVRHDQDLAYLLRVMRNTWISSARTKRAALVPLDADDAEELPDPHGDRTAQALEATAIFEALRELTPPLREAIVAVDVLGLSYKEAAGALQTKEGTIMSRLHRARTQVATLVEGPAADAAGPG